MISKRITLLSLFSFYLIFWVFINFFDLQLISNRVDLFVDTYGLMAFLGGVFGILISREWGFLKSNVGKVIFFLSLGLLFQFLGQVTYSVYYYVFGIENPYPSLGDLFYLGSVLLYIYGVWLIIEIGMLKKRLLNVSKLTQFLCVLLPLMIFIGTYSIFLKGYPFDDANLVRIFLDFAYPIGQATFVSLAFISTLIFRNYLGGVLKNSILLILLALIMQFIADTYFLYHSLYETWVVGGFGDLLFLIAYLIMGLAIINFDMESVEGLVHIENKKNVTNE